MPETDIKNETEVVNKTAVFVPTKLNSLSIRARIILFTIIATFLPASSLGWLFYVNSLQVLEEKTTKELITGVSQLQNEVDLWVKARSYDLKVFSSSFVLTENLDLLLNSSDSNTRYKNEIEDYFKLLLSQFTNYQRLMLYDVSSGLLAQSSNKSSPVDLPENWVVGGYTNDRLLIHHVKDSKYFIVAIPVLSSARKINGWLAVEMEVKLLADLFITNKNNLGAEILLLNQSGDQIVGISSIRTQNTESIISKKSALKIAATQNELVRIRDTEGYELVGVSASVGAQPWTVLMLRSEAEIFAGINQLRNISLIIALLLIALIGFISMILAQSILMPLQQLKKAAEQVSDGNLSVSLEYLGQDELGQAMKVFNSMVGKLDQSYQELELLSTTDALTGLCNRKRVMTILTEALERYRRYDSVFSILMIDIDHFKIVNDQYGHLAGDAVLREVGELFSHALRNIDTASRYGGEEFLILLDQSNENEARKTAERIRKSIDQYKFKYEDLKLHCTLSIGITTVRNSNQTENILIREADDALYVAKKEGRNRTILYIEDPTPVDIKSTKNA